MKSVLPKLISTISILLLAAVSQSIAQTPQRDNRPRTGSIAGRVTIAGKPAANAVVTVTEINLKPDSVGESGAPIPFQAKTRTDGVGGYLISGLAEGRYLVSAMLRAFVDPDSSGYYKLSRTLNLDEGEARENVSFALVRGGVITGKVIDDEGAPIVARRVQIYTVDGQGQKRDYDPYFMYEMSQTDDRGVYRIYGLPAGRYIVSAGGEGAIDPLSFLSGKFPRTYHPDTTDEKQAGVIEIKEGTEVSDVDIKFSDARKTYEAAGRVIDKETGKPVPGIFVSCSSKPEEGKHSPRYSTGAGADGQGNFKLHGLIPGRYQIGIMDFQSEMAYTADPAEFDITNDNVGGVEVKAFLGASISGFVVIEGGDAAAKNQLPSLSIMSGVTPAVAGSWAPKYRTVASVKADGSFTARGLQAGKVTFRLIMRSSGSSPPIKRIERDGVEIVDAIEVRPGEKITGVRIVLYHAQSRIRGQIQIAGGAAPDWRRLVAIATRPAPAGESKASGRIPVAVNGVSRSTLIDEKGRFLIDGLPAGEYDLSINLMRDTADGGRESVNPPLSSQRVTVGENGETQVKVTIELNRVNRPQQQEDRR